MTTIKQTVFLLIRRDPKRPCCSVTELSTCTPTPSRWPQQSQFFGSSSCTDCHWDGLGLSPCLKLDTYVASKLPRLRKELFGQTTLDYLLYPPVWTMFKPLKCFVWAGMLAVNNSGVKLHYRSEFRRAIRIDGKNLPV